MKASEAELEDLATAGDSAIRGSLIMEIRAGTGGDEAALFAGELFDMYKRFADKRGLEIRSPRLQLDRAGGTQGSRLFHHGRNGLSAAAIRERRPPRAACPGNRSPGTHPYQHGHRRRAARSDRSRSRSRDEDLRIDTFRAGGPGGQKVNKTESAIRITHLPTGIVVQCQDEKSQHKNKAKAKRVLRSRIFEHKQQLIHDERSAQRRSLIGSGGRNERIRTYNFPQGRITDHRINLTLHKIDQIMQGELDELVGALSRFDRQERLQSGERRGKAPPTDPLMP